MNSENLQKHINERCSCFYKFLNECDCQFDDDYGDCEECGTALEITPDGWLCSKGLKEIYDSPFNSRFGG
jgi:hypothetical protein